MTFRLAHRLSGGQEAPRLAQGCLLLELLQRMAQLLHLVHLLLQTVLQLAGVGLEHLGDVEEHLLVAVDGIQGQLAHGGLDPADAGGHGGLALDAEGTHLSGVVQMGAAAEFHGHAAHFHHADHVAVLLAEHGHSALLLGLLDGQHLRYHRDSLPEWRR